MSQHRKILIHTIMTLTIAAIALTGCGSNSSQLEDSGTGSYFIFDTIVSVKVYSDDVQDRHYEEIGTILKRIDQSMNRQLEGSEIDQVNQQAGKRAVQVSEETFMVVQKALSYGERTDGRFDPTIGPVVDLWGIGTEAAHVPDGTILAQTIKLVNYKNVDLNEDQRSIMLQHPGMSLDLGAIAKGYAADQIAAYLRAEGFEAAMIDLGGNILAMGTKPKQDFWTIGMQNPESTRGDTIGTIRVNNKTVVSSGIYERFLMQDNIRYHHILDPFTGYPVSNNLFSVTIVTEHSIDADALSTSVFAMGLEKGLSFTESLEGVEAFFITNEHVIYPTSGLSNQLHITDASYTKHEQ